MRALSGALCVFGLVLAQLTTISCLQIWNETTQLPSNITTECKQALTANISCNALYSVSDVRAQLPSNATDLENHCADSCIGSLDVRMCYCLRKRSTEINMLITNFCHAGLGKLYQ